MFGLLHFGSLLACVSIGCAFVVKDCITLDGKDYRGRQQNSYTGKICLNWNQINGKFEDLNTGVGDHNFCRNPDGSETPWCYVSELNGVGQKEACDITICQEASATEETGPSPTPSRRMVETFEPENPLPSQVEGAVVQPVKGVQQQVRTGPKKKKDLGAVGHVLAVLMMAIIILLGVGITVGYFYKRLNGSIYGTKWKKNSGAGISRSSTTSAFTSERCIASPFLFLPSRTPPARWWTRTPSSSWPNPATRPPPRSPPRGETHSWDRQRGPPEHEWGSE